MLWHTIYSFALALLPFVSSIVSFHFFLPFLLWFSVLFSDMQSTKCKELTRNSHEWIWCTVQMERIWKSSVATSKYAIWCAIFSWKYELCNIEALSFCFSLFFFRFFRDKLCNIDFDQSQYSYLIHRIRIQFSNFSCLLILLLLLFEIRYSAITMI